MPYMVDHNGMLTLKNLVQNTIVTHPKLVEIGEIAGQRFHPDIIQISANQLMRLTTRRPTGLSKRANSRAAAFKLRT